MIEFLWPWVFLLLPLPLLVNRLMPRAANREAALHVPFYRSLARVEHADTSLRNRSTWITLLAILAWALLVTAASRPQWVGAPVDLPTTGRDLMMVVDISGSMEAQDMQLQGQNANRLDVVKDVIGDFVERRTGDRLGLILFAARAYTQSPLTFDRQTVKTLLDEARIGIVEENATAIGDGIGLGIRHLRDRPESSRVIIMLTDGVNNAGAITPIQAGELAARENIRVHTIAIGADSVMTNSLFGPRSINPSADLDEETLTAIADMTGGRFFRGRDREELEEIYAVLDELEPVDQEAETYRPIMALFYWPLALALLLSLIIAGLRIPWRQLRAALKDEPSTPAETLTQEGRA